MTDITVLPGPGGCTCGMPDDKGVLVGGDCRSLGCDPECPACGTDEEQGDG